MTQARRFLGLRACFLLEDDYNEVQSFVLPSIITNFIEKRPIMKNILDYLTWEHVELGVRIIGCDKSFEGAMVIPDHINGVAVVKIGEKAFAECKKITSVVLPDSVESVGEGAFFYCFGLEELHLGAGIKKIEKQAFTGCSSLRRVVLPSTLEALARDAFDKSVDLVAADDM